MVDPIHDHMLYFLENHDEQRVASDFFAGDAFRAYPAFVVNTLMRSNPFMVYAGQEYGERGMDAEGFSGKDGRTTIFDYWTVPSLYRAYVDNSRVRRRGKTLTLFIPAYPNRQQGEGCKRRSVLRPYVCQWAFCLKTICFPP